MKYLERIPFCKNQVAKQLFQIMHNKQSNLGIAIDAYNKDELLLLTERLGPYACIIKTHIDIIQDFSWDLIEKLQALSIKQNFLLFEDRKFADIGKTVESQYKGGIYRIAEWAHITNAHSVPGPGIIEGLQNIGLKKNRGLLLLAQMSSKDTLAKGEYTDKTLTLANQYSEFVMGFIALKKLTNNPQFIHMTPGVQLETGKDNLGQQYQTPEYVIKECLSDVIIVGRGITHSSHPEKTAEIFRKRGILAYEACH